MNTIDSFLTEWNSREAATTTLNKRAKSLYDGVLEVELSKSGRPNTLRINSIKSNKYRSGKLAKFMEWIVKSADSGKFTLSLVAQPFGWNKDELPSKDKIKEVMEKYGFKVVFEYPDSLGYEMVRESK